MRNTAIIWPDDRPANWTCLQTECLKVENSKYHPEMDVRMADDVSTVSPTPPATREMLESGHQSITARHSLFNSIGRLLARKAGFGGASCHCRGPLIPAQWLPEEKAPVAASAVGGNCTAATTLQHANVAVTSLSMEHAWRLDI